MHWLLSVPDTFSLREVIRRSGWLLYPPFHVQALGDQLLRVERLEGDTTVGLTVYQAPAGLVVQAEPHLSGMEVEEASQKIWHMLRLDENIQPFLRSAHYHDALKSVKRMGGRLLRGVDLFEHVTVATLVTWDAEGMPEFERVAGLVDRLGFPLPRNPTLHSFPTPERILVGTASLDDVFSPDTVTRLARIAQLFTTRSGRIELLVRQPIGADELAGRLADELQLDEPGLGLLMLYLGRYDYIPTDGVAQQRVEAFWQNCAPITRQGITALFDRWHPWGGLAYWLWDWSKVPAPTSDVTPC
jgi:3-methyladenine DNA glycosylase/8-oxoguanine DNA glycosylase